MRGGKGTTWLQRSRGTRGRWVGAQDDGIACDDDDDDDDDNDDIYWDNN